METRKTIPSRDQLELYIRASVAKIFIRHLRRRRQTSCILLQKITAFRHKETLITVVGCGGNRDTTKRPEMAAVAVKLSDRVILTSDNPRNEDPDEIIRQMKAGVAEEDKGKVLSITNRREAIRTAVALAKKGDIILVAGKGHETYQDVKGVKHHFDDREELENAFKEK